MPLLNAPRALRALQIRNGIYQDRRALRFLHRLHRLPWRGPLLPYDSRSHALVLSDEAQGSCPCDRFPGIKYRFRFRLPSTDDSYLQLLRQC